MKNEAHGGFLAKSVVVGGFSGVVGLLTGIIVSRQLGPDERGILAAVVTTTDLVVACFSLTTSQAVVAFFSQRKFLAPFIEKRLLYLSLISGAVVMTVAVSFSEGFNISHRNGAFILATLLIPIYFSNGVLAGYAIAVRDLALLYIPRYIQQLCYLILACFVLRQLGEKADYVILALVLSAAIALFAQVILGRREIKKQLPIRDIFNISKYSAICNISGFAYHLSIRGDQIVIASLLGAGVLGHYAVASSWASLVGVMMTGATPALISIAAQVGNDAGRVSELRRVALRSLALLIAAGAVLSFLGRILIPVIFGEEYIFAGELSTLVCWVACSTVVRQWCQEVARTVNCAKHSIFIEIISLAVGASLLLLLLPKFGVWGAIIATASSNMVSIGQFVLLLNKKIRPIKT